MPFAEVECLRDVGVQCARDGPCACCCKIHSILFTLMGTNISPQKNNIEDDVSFPKGEYVSSLEGNECETSRRF